MSHIPEVLATLESDFRQKGGFPHLQRLRSMLYMYGATVVEVVRRREFSKLTPFSFFIVFLTLHSNHR
jgi:autophagy-related protein 11